MSTHRREFRYLERLRVRWAEVDLQRVVFNGHYLLYFDSAVAGWWRAMGLPYESTLRHFNGDLFVRKATVEYHASARFDELLEIGIRAARIGNTSLTVHAAAFRGEELLVSAELVYVYTGATEQVPRPVPGGLRSLFDAYEAGEPMLEVHCGAWQELEDHITPVRDLVFVQEQRLAPELVWDGTDSGALHALVRNRVGLPLACGRLLPTEDGMGRIGRMAVRPELRGSGAGRLVLEALLSAARARGDREVVLHAQGAAVGFYARQGFAPRGGPLMEAGLVHQPMARTP